MAEFLDQPLKRETPGGSDRRAAAAAELARRAGKIALDYFERAEITWKADDSMVTEADVTIESWLEDEIAGAFPAAAVLGESGGVLTAADGGTLFPIDPHAYGGEPIAFLAGDPVGHRGSLADIRLTL